MCGGSGCCSGFGMCMGEMAYTIEKLFACLAFTAVVSTIVFTLLWMLGAGVGLGYNYCYVETRLNQTLKAAKAYQRKPSTIPTTVTPWTTPGTPPGNTPPAGRRRRRSKDLIPKLLEKPSYLETYQVFNRPEEGSLETVKVSNKYWRLKQMASSTDSNIEIKPTIVVPLRHFGLIILIKKLQTKSSNFTLELITGNS